MYSIGTLKTKVQICYNRLQETSVFIVRMPCNNEMCNFFLLFALTVYS
jgi:hypothetical protein